MAAQVVVEPGKSGRSRNAAEPEHGNPLHIRPHAHARGEPGVERRRGDTGDGGAHQQIQLRGRQPGGFERTRQSPFPEFQAGSHPCRVGLAEVPQSRVPVDGQSEVTGPHPGGSVQSAQHCAVRSGGETEVADQLGEFVLSVSMLRQGRTDGGDDALPPVRIGPQPDCPVGVHRRRRDGGEPVDCGDTHDGMSPHDRRRDYLAPVSLYLPGPPVRATHRLATLLHSCHPEPTLAVTMFVTALAAMSGRGPVDVVAVGAAVLMRPALDRMVQRRGGRGPGHRQRPTRQTRCGRGSAPTDGRHGRRGGARRLCAALLAQRPCRRGCPPHGRDRRMGGLTTWH